MSYIDNDPNNPENQKEDRCKYCDEYCNGEFCNSRCKKGYINENFR